MTNLLLTADDAELPEVEREDTAFSAKYVRDLPTRAYIEDLWRGGEAEHFAEIADLHLGRLQQIETKRYVQAFGRWAKVKMSLAHGEIEFGEAIEFRVADAETAVEFFVHATPAEFSTFCSLLRDRLQPSKLGERLTVLIQFAEVLSTPVNAGWRRLFEASKSDPVQRQLLEPAKPSTQETVAAASQHHADGFVVTSATAMASGEIDAGLDMIYREVDRLLKAGSYRELNAVFASTDAASAPIDLTLGLLTATLPVKTRLSSRPDFLLAVAEALSRSGKDAAKLLAGLA